MKRLRPAAAHSRTPSASGSHVCGPIRVFSDAHVAGKNRSDFFRGCGRELCEAFLDKLRTFLPLPMGEVAERSEDGEGNNGRAPSQSPSVTALPMGEPRRLRATSSNETRCAGLSFEETACAPQRILDTLRTPCLSLWERWPSAARTERADNGRAAAFKKGCKALSVTFGDSSPRGRAKAPAGAGNKLK